MKVLLENKNATRGRDEQGRIVASIEDYAAVRRLVADLVSEGVEAAVPKTIRKTRRRRSRRPYGPRSPLRRPPPTDAGRPGPSGRHRFSLTARRDRGTRQSKTNLRRPRRAESRGSEPSVASLVEQGCGCSPSTTAEVAGHRHAAIQRESGDSTRHTTGAPPVLGK